MTEKSISREKFDNIRPGDRVQIQIQNRFGKRWGRAVMRGPCGWVLNMGGRHGTPGIADVFNTTAIRKARENA